VTGRCGNGDIGKAGRMASAARKVGQGASDRSCRGVEGHHAITIKMQHGLEPARRPNDGTRYNRSQSAKPSTTN
jgi:hypothetical protein